MTMVRSLGGEYSHFASSLMLLKSLDKSELQAAFLAEEVQRRRCPEGPGGDAAMFSTSGTCKCGPTATCYFCEQPGHSRPLELVHTDVHQVSYPSFSGCRYWVSFIDDYSRYRFILPIKAKSDVFEV